MARYAFFGDLKLGTELRGIVPTWPRNVIQTFTGVDRTRGFVSSNSPNYTCELDVIAFVAPESDYSKKGFRARELAYANALIARSETPAPVVWVEDSSRSKTVTSATGGTVTCAGHGFSNGDKVLIRRSGATLYTYSAVGSVTSSTFVVSATHTINAGDDIHLVEQAYSGMTYQQMSPIHPGEGGDYYAEEITFSFVGSGTTTYARTSVTL
jgi:hypothetical protein